MPYHARIATPSLRADGNGLLYCVAMAKHADSHDRTSPALDLAREVLEIILHSTAYVGMPTTIMQRRMLEKVLAEDGRSAELA